MVKEIARCWSLMSKEDRMVYKIEAKRGKLDDVVINQETIKEILTKTGHSRQ